MTTWDLLITDANVATMVESNEPYGIVKDVALAISDGRIAWIGSKSEVPDTLARKTQSAQGRWLTPALIDCHTHLVFAGDRAAEFEQRLKGASYEEIARAGGGIRSTVNATRKATREELVECTKMRLESLVAEGVATVEIKSGYGLDFDTEIAQLEAARSLARHSEASIVTTFLGAHSIPLEYQDRGDDYLNFVISEVLPAVSDRNLADAVDAYCESIAFSANQVARLFDQASDFGLPVKLHADQLSDGGGAEIAAAFDALSADHLEYTSRKGVEALAGTRTVAVLLPGAFLTLGETQLPPVEILRDLDVPIALATDCNPGTSPLCSLRLAMNLGTSLFHLTPEECLAGVTRNAAKALGLERDRGTLEVGKRADIAEWNIGHPRELTYWAGLNQLCELRIEGKIASL